MSEIQASIIMHHRSEVDIEPTLLSVFTQTNKNLEIIILSESGASFLKSYLDTKSSIPIPVSVIDTDAKKTLGQKLNIAFSEAKAASILYIDNYDSQVCLKQSAIDLFLLTFKHHTSAGCIYADYELEEEGRLKEIHVLKHHIGRVRDNQDYGRVFFLRKKCLSAIGNADEENKYNTLYDLRLKISEQFELIHLANRYAGSLYRVVAAGKAHDVFDYLKAGKDIQIEAEEVVSKHLKRIGAYLEPGSHYTDRPESSNISLTASVIIPVNNRPEFIGKAIESVQAQNVQDVEVIIVVNGGPDDPTISEVKRYMSGGDNFNPHKPEVQLLVFDINNLGLCLNMGARAARGSYYVQLDSDDRLKPDAVEKIVKVFNSDSKIGMVIGSYEVWQLDKEGNYSRMKELPVITHDEWTEENGRNNLLRINGAGAPRSIPINLIRQTGFSMNEEPFTRNYGEDYNMVLQISEKHRIGRVWNSIYEVVRHEGGTDHNIDQHTIDRNDEAKDYMREQAILRRIKFNK